METNIIALAATLGTTVIGAFVGAFLSSRFGYLTAIDQAASRKRHFDEVLTLPHRGTD